MSPVVRVAVLAIAAVGVAGVLTEPAFAGPRVYVERSAVGVRLAASAAPLPVVLAELRRVAPLAIEGVQHATAAVVTAEFELPLEAALRRLMRGYSFVLTESPSGLSLRILGPALSTPTASEVEAVSGHDVEASPEPLRSTEDVERLTRLISEEALQVIVDTSSSDDPDTRLQSLSALAQIGQEALGLLTAAVGDPDPIVRSTAVQFLAGVGQEAIGQLVTVFRDVRDAQLRLVVLSAVAAVGGAASAEMFALAARDPDPAVRAHAQRLSAGASPGGVPGTQ
jgi:HEAT repeat protein